MIFILRNSEPNQRTIQGERKRIIMPIRQRIALFLTVILTLMSFTGCRKPTEENIAGRTSAQVSSSFSFDSLAYPKESGTFVREGYRVWDAEKTPDELAGLFFGGTEFTAETQASGITYHTDNSVLKLNTPRENQSDGFRVSRIDFQRNDLKQTTADMLESMLFTTANLSDTNEWYGKPAYQFADPATDDPKMTAYRAQSESIVRYVHGEEYKCVLASRYTKETVDTLYALGYYTANNLGYKRTEQAERELYVFCYEFTDDGMNASNLDYKGYLIFDGDGLLYAKIIGPCEFDAMDTYRVCAPQGAYEFAKMYLPVGHWTLCAMQFCMDRGESTPDGAETYQGVWKLYFLKEPEEVSPEMQEKLKNVRVYGIEGFYDSCSVTIRAEDVAVLHYSGAVRVLKTVCNTYELAKAPES